MNKALAIIFGILSFGAIKETFRIATSTAPDISVNRGELLPMGFIISIVFIVLTIVFWRRSTVKKL